MPCGNVSLHMWTVKAQIRLRGCIVWSGLCCPHPESLDTIKCINGEQRHWWDQAHVQDVVNPHILHMLKGTCFAWSSPYNLEAILFQRNKKKNIQPNILLICSSLLPAMVSPLFAEMVLSLSWTCSDAWKIEKKKHTINPIACKSKKQHAF